MMAVIRFIYDFLRKEELYALAYIRKHRRRNWLIALDALLTMSIVFGGVAYASQSSKEANSVELMRVGAMPMSASEFIEHAHASGVREYWLGDKKGFGIFADERDEDEGFVSYIKDGSDPRDLSGREITIVTFRDSTSVEGSRQFSAGSDISTSVTASGLVVQYDRTSMMSEVVLMNGTSSKVTIHYIVAQPLETLMDNAMALRVAE